MTNAPYPTRERGAREGGAAVFSDEAQALRAQALIPGSQMQPVPFAGGTLMAVTDSEGMAWLAIKPACAVLGLDHEAQRQRLERCAWSVACVMQATGADAKRYRMYCLRGDRVAMWLATLDARRVKPALRGVLSVWQCQAADALHTWAQGQRHGHRQHRQLDLFQGQQAAIRDLIRDEVRAQLAMQAGSEQAAAGARSAVHRRALAHRFLCELVAAACHAYQRPVTSAEVLAFCSDHNAERLERCLDWLSAHGRSNEPARKLGYALRSTSRNPPPGFRLVASERIELGRRWSAEPTPQRKVFHA